jgi:hypothetical protein
MDIYKIYKQRTSMCVCTPLTIYHHLSSSIIIDHHLSSSIIIYPSIPSHPILSKWSLTFDAAVNLNRLVACYIRSYNCIELNSWLHLVASLRMSWYFNASWVATLQPAQCLFQLWMTCLQDLLYHMIWRIEDALVFIHAPLASPTVFRDFPWQHLA